MAWLSLLCLFLSTYANAKTDGADFKLQLENVELRSVVVQFANIDNINLIAGNELQNHRVNLRESAIRLTDSITKLARQQHLTIKKQQDILLIASECRLSQDVSIRKTKALDRKLTLNFQKIATDSIFTILSDFAEYHFHLPGKDKLSLLSIRIKNQPTHAHLKAIATVLGWTLDKIEHKEIVFTPNEKCPVDNKQPPPVNTIAEDVPQRFCPKGRERRCMPLEYYKLEEMIPRGYITNLKTHTKTAFVETVDGLTHLLQEGQFLGQHSGELRWIEDDGTLFVTGLVEDNRGGWIKKDFQLKTGETYESPKLKNLRLKTAPVMTAQAQQDFISAAANGDLKTINTLIENKAVDINASYQINGQNALTTACVKNQTRVVRTLLDHGAKPDLRTSESLTTALHITAGLNYVDAATMLLKAKADANANDSFDLTPILYAIKIQDNAMPMINLLVQHGADLSHPSSAGITPFTGAAYDGRIEIIKLFLQHGLDINSTDKNGYNMLHAATQGIKPDMVKFLIQNGANINSGNRNGETIMDTALKVKHAQIIEYLKNPDPIKSNTK